MTWAFPVDVGGTYEVRLLFAEIYNGVSEAGDRVFDVSVDGSVPVEFDDIDPFATAGPGGAMARTAIVTTTDDVLDVEFLHVIENPALKGIEILQLGASPGVIGATPTNVDFGFVTEGSTSSPQPVTLSNLGASGDPDITIDTVSVSGAAFSTTVDVEGDVVAPGGSIELGIAFAPSAVGPASGTVTIDYSFDPGTGTVSDSLTVDVSGEGTPSFAGVLTATPDPLGFPVVEVGQSSSTLQVALRNEGGAGDPTITVGTPAIDSTQFSAGPPSSSVIAGSSTAAIPVTFSPSSVGDVTATLTIPYSYVDPGTGATVDSSASVLLAGTGADPDSIADALFRVNAGGGEIAATDSGPAWEEDSSSNNSQYLVENGSNTTAPHFGISPDDSVPAETPAQIWFNERWETAGGEEMQYSFPVPTGNQVVVRLYLGNGCSCTQESGERVFDVTVDGDVVLDDLDLSDRFGHLVGHMFEIPVTSDGSVDIEFLHVVENPLINAIEILNAEPEAGVLGVGSPSLEFGDALVTSGSVTVDASVTNLGGPGDPVIALDTVWTDPSTDFVAGAPSSPSLDPGASATIPVTFDPTAAGALSASLMVAYSSSAGTGEVAIQLTGTGTAPTPIADALVAEPASVSFPSTLVAGGVNVENVVLSNAGVPGEGQIVIDSVSSSDPQFAPSPAPADPLAVGESVPLQVQFDPTSAGSQSSTLVVEYTRGGESSTLWIALDGLGSTDVAIDELSWTNSTRSSVSCRSLRPRWTSARTADSMWASSPATSSPTPSRSKATTTSWWMPS